MVLSLPPKDWPQSPFSHWRLWLPVTHGPLKQTLPSSFLFVNWRIRSITLTQSSHFSHGFLQFDYVLYESAAYGFLQHLDLISISPWFLQAVPKKSSRIWLLGKSKQSFCVGLEEKQPLCHQVHPENPCGTCSSPWVHLSLFCFDSGLCDKHGCAFANEGVMQTSLIEFTHFIIRWLVELYLLVKCLWSCVWRWGISEVTTTSSCHH